MFDINTLRIVATLAAFAAFIGIIAWAFHKPHAKRFEEAARLPFEQD
ncbi:MAG: CcoQ/FixQ family Cbb3-type cytochrome c oxidase assembly chaperone [Burkholderiales bacterium]|nr:CcoQ/FixQ family Cbb3-type cytochrome c oxidase assembly chaperone [Burkholderiales bacterium]